MIPGYTSAIFYVRTIKATDIERVMTKVENCFRAAGIATGCEATWKWRDLGTTKCEKKSLIYCCVFFC